MLYEYINTAHIVFTYCGTCYPDSPINTIKYIATIKHIQLNLLNFVSIQFLI